MRLIQLHEHRHISTDAFDEVTLSSGRVFFMRRGRQVADWGPCPVQEKDFEKRSEHACGQYARLISWLSYPMNDTPFKFAPMNTGPDSNVALAEDETGGPQT